MGNAGWGPAANDGGTPVPHGKREKGREWVELDADRWAPLGVFNRIQKFLKFIQTWFAPKLTFLDSTNLNKNTGR
jgi:hypothetical protein